MATLTIETKYSDQTPLPESYIFRLTGCDNDPKTQKELKKRRYTYDPMNKEWSKRRYAEGCNQKARQKEIEALKAIEPELEVKHESERDQ